MPALIWMPERVCTQCVADADYHYPNETGGVFMGYLASGAVVITAMILGGKGATRTRLSYEPDLEWQNMEIARHYAQSGRRDTYLGDWHTHPDTLRAYLSRHDKAVVRKIMQSAEARCSNPIMVVFAGSKGSWSPEGWRGRMDRLLWLNVLKLEPAFIRQSA